MKTFNRSDVYSWSNAGDAKAYVGKEGYFGDSLSELDTQVRGVFKSILTDVYADDTDKVSHPFGSSDDETWGVFLPAEKVIEAADKKYRPFRDIDEMKSTLDIELGDEIVYRYTGEKDLEIHAIFSSYSISNSGFSAFMLSTFKQPIGPAQAYAEIEWKREGGEWLPFGAEVDE